MILFVLSGTRGPCTRGPLDFDHPAHSIIVTPLNSNRLIFALTINAVCNVHIQCESKKYPLKLFPDIFTYGEPV